MQSIDKKFNFSDFYNYPVKFKAESAIPEDFTDNSVVFILIYGWFETHRNINPKTNLPLVLLSKVLFL